MLKTLAEIDLGRSILSFVIILGFFLVLLTVVRSIEIPIRIYLDKRKEKKSLTTKEGVKEKKGFENQ